MATFNSYQSALSQQSNQVIADVTAKSASR